MIVWTMVIASPGGSSKNQHLGVVDSKGQSRGQKAIQTAVAQSLFSHVEIVHAFCSNQILCNRLNTLLVLLFSHYVSSVCAVHWCSAASTAFPDQHGKGNLLLSRKRQIISHACADAPTTSSQVQLRQHPPCA